MQLACETGTPLLELAAVSTSVHARLALIAGGVYGTWNSIYTDWYFWGNLCNVVASAGYVVINFGRALLTSHDVSLNGLYLAIALTNLASAVFYLFSWNGSFPHPDAVTVWAEYLNIIASAGFVASSALYSQETTDPIVTAVLLVEGVMCAIYLADSLLYAYAWYADLPPGLPGRGCTLRDPEMAAQILNVVPSFLYCVGSATGIWLHATLPARRADSASLAEALRTMARVSIWGDILFTADAGLYCWAWARDLRAEVAPQPVSQRGDDDYDGAFGGMGKGRGGGGDGPAPLSVRHGAESNISSHTEADIRAVRTQVDAPPAPTASALIPPLLAHPLRQSEDGDGDGDGNAGRTSLPRLVLASLSGVTVAAAPPATAITTADGGGAASSDARHDNHRSGLDSGSSGSSFAGSDDSVSVCTDDIEHSSLAGDALADFMAAAELAAERGEDVEGYDALMPCRRAALRGGRTLSHALFAVTQWCGARGGGASARRASEGEEGEYAPYMDFDSEGEGGGRGRGSS